MSFYFNKIQNPVDYFIQSLEICNKHPTTWFIDEQFKVQTTGAAEKKQADRQIVSLFLEYINQKTSTDTLFWKTIKAEKWLQIKTTLTQFIRRSSELSAEDKSSFERGISNGIQAFLDIYDPLTKAKRLVLSQKQDKLFDIDDVRFLEAALERLGLERVSIYYLQLYLLADWHKYIVGDIFEKQGGAVKSCDKQRYSIDWEKCPKQNAEEFAMAASLESAHNNGASSYLPTLKKLIKATSEQGEPLPAVLEIWRTFYGVFQLDKVSSYFIEALQSMRGPISSFARDPDTPFFSAEVKELYEQMFAMQTEPLFRTTIHQGTKKAYIKEKLKAMLIPADKYLLQHDAINDFYTTLYNTFQGQKKLHKGYVDADVSLLLGSQLPSPDTFRDMKMPLITLDAFERAVEQDFARYSEALLEQDEAFSAESFLHCLFGSLDNPVSQDALRRYCKYVGVHRTFRKKPSPVASPAPVAAPAIDQLSADFAALHIKKPVERKKAAKKPRFPHTYALISPPNPTAVPATKSKKQKGIRTLMLEASRLLTDPRVRDWCREEPQALQEPSYARLSSDNKEKEKLFHSYPFLITECLMKHAPAEQFTSQATQKLHTLYSRPGTIHCYKTNDEPIQGYFADCFDEYTLYHHYFHQRKFSALIPRYASHESLINEKERHVIAAEAKKIQTLIASDETVFAVGTLNDRFILQKKRYSIEVDDTLLGIRYTLCFPEWTQDAARDAISPQS